MFYILDADWVIDALVGRNRAADTIVALAPQGIAISWVTVGEVYEGAYGFPDPESHLRSLREFLHPFYHLTLNDPIMERFADIRSTLRRQGQIISDFDILLAATALHYDLTVLTRNSRHLSRVSNLKLYRAKA
jgi:predicted nucleic acid-binding protein